MPIRLAHKKFRPCRPLVWTANVRLVEFDDPRKISRIYEFRVGGGMGARGKLAEHTTVLALKLSAAHRYRLESLALARGSMADTIRLLIDRCWEEEHGRQTQED